LRSHISIDGWNVPTATKEPATSDGGGDDDDDDDDDDDEDDDDDDDDDDEDDDECDDVELTGSVASQVQHSGNDGS
jgi:hypothetical protein